MITPHVILISLFVTGIVASTYCDQQIKEIKKSTETHLYPCGLPPPDNCCVFKENYFDQSPSGVFKMNNWLVGAGVDPDLWKGGIKNELRHYIVSGLIG